MQDILSISQELSRGLFVTISILIASSLFAYFMGFVSGLLRLSKHTIIRKLTGLYIELFRGTSLIVQLFWLYYAIPMLFGINLGSNWIIGVIAIGLNYGAYLSEVVRGSVEAVDEGQTEAAIALNLSSFQKMRYIILPQAVRMMLPEFGNYTIQMLKGTALVSLISLNDILYYGNILRSSNLSQAPLIYLVILIFYFVLALPLIFLTRKAEEVSKKGVAN
ncbi:ectoine/hydroxyectoine ABC transporter permease subunit EhuC [Halolactibacillus miurensis]|jgi:polar amino acid transport system permease protein|uniref:Ectoine/hydroxyectoine ABC transporter permease subunit EhuC n=1 Tax=Halolactibacillus miurensis TaxID=306541 RepID=A0A1I6SJK0_9BACI|nr:ectoine/hydroxyectoine ABC transporter permease subunit EhuC [Halolactibacillus miurensis]GEM04050.1 ectoine/hydroxyectoine ABC transporter permease subunit EhuC [Halolactibacillus miurensis]SFS77151.1 polar amino acid transport system permease protein [Halolactibacillus miurensis]